MRMRGVRTLFSVRFLSAPLALLLLAYPAICADKSKTGGGSGGGSHSSGSGGGAAAHSSGTPSGGGSGAASGSHSAAPTGGSGGTSSGSHSAAPTGGSGGGTSYGSHSAAPTGGSGGTSYGSHSGPPTGGSPSYGSHSGPPTGGSPSYGSHSGPPTGGGPSYGSHSGPPTGGGQHFGNNGPGAASHGATLGYGHGMAAPHGHVMVETRNGAMMRRPDGRIATFHDNQRGMDVHHGLGGARVVIVEHGDHSRVFVGHGGYGYVQHPYRYNGHEYAQRSYYSNGHYYHAFYGRYYFHGVYVNPYFPRAYYRPAFYGWAYNPWARPVSYGWGWGGRPWFGYYGSYFTPYPVYASPSLWLTDYLIANSLQSAYEARADAQAAALYNPAPLTPDVKQLIADEVREQISLENTEAQASSGSNAEPDAASSSIQRLLTDGRPHVFVAGAALDVTDAGGNECALSEGDALQLRGPVAPDAQAANLAVMASKGGRECPKGDVVAVALGDLQDMQNHMRETIDAGLQEMQSKQGQGGLPPAPAAAVAPPTPSPMAALAPPPPPESEVAAEINRQSQAADQAEKEAGSGPGPNAPAPAGEPISISVGQSIDQVTAALGTPVKVVNLGAKKIYVYKDMKVTFIDGRVTDVQ